MTKWKSPGFEDVAAVTLSAYIAFLDRATQPAMDGVICLDSHQQRLEKRKHSLAESTRHLWQKVEQLCLEKTVTSERRALEPP
jgi:hypothetical protein